MRIYYDELRKNIVLGTTNRLFAAGSLIALPEAGRISVIYRSNSFRELWVKHTQILRENGSPAGSTLSSVVAYLNAEFNRSPYTDTADQALSIVLGSTVLANRAITTNAAGQGIYADASDVSTANRVLGISVQAGTMGSEIKFQQEGFMTNSGWNFNPTLPIYLGFGGEITQSQVGAVCVHMGYAVSATTININIDSGIIRA